MFRWDLHGRRLLRARGSRRRRTWTTEIFSTTPGYGSASPPAGERFGGGVERYEVQRDLQFGSLSFAGKLLFGS
jgi:hypothetical protein